LQSAPFPSLPFPFRFGALFLFAISLFPLFLFAVLIPFLAAPKALSPTYP